MNTKNILNMRKKCVILPQLNSPMRNSTTGSATPIAQPKRKPYNIAFDPSLKAALVDYCAKNRRAGDPSDVIERVVLAHIRAKARRYRLDIPAHLLA